MCFDCVSFYLLLQSRDGRWRSSACVSDWPTDSQCISKFEIFRVFRFSTFNSLAPSLFSQNITICKKKKGFDSNSHVHAYMHTCLHTPTYLLTYTHTYIHPYIHTHTHLPTNTHTYILEFPINLMHFHCSAVRLCLPNHSSIVVETWCTSGSSVGT